MRGPAVCEQRAVVSHDRVLVAEAGPSQVAAAGADVHDVVEAGRHHVAAEGFEHERLEALVAQRLVAAGVRAQVLDARDLEPDEVGGVVRDPLRVGVREADADGRRERIRLHESSLAWLRLRLTGIAKLL